MAHTKQDVDDTARLVLMEMKDDGSLNMTAGNRIGIFRDRMIYELEEFMPFSEVTNLWVKYMGMDRRAATHDFETGRRL